MKTYCIFDCWLDKRSNLKTSQLYRLSSSLWKQVNWLWKCAVSRPNENRKEGNSSFFGRYSCLQTSLSSCQVRHAGKALSTRHSAVRVGANLRLTDHYDGLHSTYDIQVCGIFSWQGRWRQTLQRWAHLRSVQSEYRGQNPPSPSLHHFHLTFSTRRGTLKPFSRRRR